MPTRRQLVLGAAATAGGLYINHRGLRYPRLSFESNLDLEHPELVGAQVKAIGLFATPRDNGVQLRAFEPEPQLQIKVSEPQELSFALNNVAKNAILTAPDGPNTFIKETIDGITRRIEIKARTAQVIDLQWLMPSSAGVDFAVIGDTGAGQELKWALRRADELGAQFLLHLGDFNYQPGEYEEAIKLFRNAPIPCYISIGNHDFNDSGLVYEKFLTHLGPLNHTFNIAGTQFVNLDTAANFFPAYSGQRGELLDQLAEQQSRVSDVVCFTHRNFLDPRPGRDHTISGIRERPWLASKLQACGADHLLSGHVHHSAELQYRGMKQWIVGEGLGFEDIVHEQLVAKMLMGHAERGRKVQYSWRALNLPWAMHTSPEHEEKLKLEHPPEKLEWYRQKLAQSMAVTQEA